MRVLRLCTPPGLILPKRLPKSHVSVLHKPCTAAPSQQSDGLVVCSLANKCEPGKGMKGGKDAGRVKGGERVVGSS